MQGLATVQLSGLFTVHRIGRRCYKSYKKGIKCQDFDPVFPSFFLRFERMNQHYTYELSVREFLDTVRIIFWGGWVCFWYADFLLAVHGLFCARLRCWCVDFCLSAGIIQYWRKAALLEVRGLNDSVMQFVYYMWRINEGCEETVKKIACFCKFYFHKPV
jgi:hypothetical protein